MARPADDSEKDVLEQFRNAVREIVSPDQLSNDAYLLRWIRARDRNLDKALIMFKQSMEWRRVNNVDIRREESISSRYNDFFKCYFGGIDKHGRPVVCVPIGEWDMRPMLDAGEKDAMLVFLAQALEILDLTMQEMWKNKYPRETKWQHTQFTVIGDLTGFTYAKMMHKKSIETLLELTKLYEANYPETLGAGIAINAPWIFATLFAMIKPLLSEHTISKIAIFDSKEANWKKAILNVVDADQIPTRFGGTRVEYHPV